MLTKNNSLILMIDMQESLVSATKAEKEVQQAEKLLKAAELLKVPVLYTEQNPKGLGNTVNSLVKETNTLIEKTSFSLLKEKNAFDILRLYHKKQIIIFGIEAHICVYQTASDLAKNGYDVYFVKDLSKSRKDFDFETSIELMRQFGIKITSLETVLFELLENSKNSKFKEIQSLIK